MSKRAIQNRSYQKCGLNILKNQINTLLVDQASRGEFPSTSPSPPPKPNPVVLAPPLQTT